MYEAQTLYMVLEKETEALRHEYAWAIAENPFKKCQDIHECSYVNNTQDSLSLSLTLSVLLSLSITGAIKQHSRCNSLSTGDCQCIRKI